MLSLLDSVLGPLAVVLTIIGIIGIYIYTLKRIALSN